MGYRPLSCWQYCSKRLGLKNQFFLDWIPSFLSAVAFLLSPALNSAQKDLLFWQAASSEVTAAIRAMRFTVAAGAGLVTLMPIRQHPWRENFFSLRCKKHAIGRCFTG